MRRPRQELLKSWALPDVGRREKVAEYLQTGNDSGSDHDTQTLEQV
jgi:hypothetical protein